MPETYFNIGHHLYDGDNEAECQEFIWFWNGSLLVEDADEEIDHDQWLRQMPDDYVPILNGRADKCPGQYTQISVRHWDYRNRENPIPSVAERSLLRRFGEDSIINRY